MSVVLETPHVTVRARLAVIELRQRAGSEDDWTVAGVLVVAVGGTAALLTAPLSAATVVLGPFVLLAAVFGVWMLVQRLLRPAVHLDCVAWTAQGAGLPARRSFGRPPVVHTSSARSRYGGTDVVLTAQGCSTIVLGRLPADEAEEVARTLRRLVRERTLT